MHPAKRIEVEPLSEPRWAKIEKSVFEQLEREELGLAPIPKMASVPPPGRSWRWRPAAALVMAGAMAAAVGALATKSIWSSSGPSPVASASRIVTAGSDSHLALGESDVDVAPDSAALVSGDDDHGVLVVLDRGKVDCKVAPRKGRPPFVVQAGDVRVRVLGTQFSVARDAQGGGAHVLVAHGIVDVSSHGQTVTLHDGESWPPASAAPQTPPLPQIPSTAATTTQNDTPKAAPAPQRGKVARTPKRVPAFKGAPQAPLAAAPDAIEPPVTPQAKDPSAPPSLNLPPPPTATAPAPQAVNAPPQPAPLPSSAPIAPATPEQLYTSAANLEKRDPISALGMYRQAAASNDRFAAPALFAAGRLQFERNQRADAQRLLNEYLTRFPNGVNAGQARELLDKIR